MSPKLRNEEYDALENKLIIEFATKQSQETLHQMVMDSWDCTSCLKDWRVDNPFTDKATMLMIYWKCNPGNIKTFKDKNAMSTNPYNRKLLNFVEKIESNYVNGFYKSGSFQLDPEFWVKQHSEIEQSTRIPEIMFEKVEGKKVAEPLYSREECPPELDILLDELFDSNFK
ncbi:DUF4274 domain-containing protein [Aquimarina sp. SS2-1]|uniref:DUF4274 domain-containing protein n=1 Tax=Aquimarina besae TaxID=3342247 RepID=UPI00366E0131